MPRVLVKFVRFVDRLNRYVGLFAMYLIFAMIGILVFSSLTKFTPYPPIWTLEMAQFAMVAYYLLGGGYSMQEHAHVRMDLMYSRWSDRTKAIFDALTVFCLIFYLCVLLYGGFSSTFYSINYGERSYSAWRPYMAPIKIIMVVGMILMLLQAISMLIKDIAKVRGVELK